VRQGRIKAPGDPAHAFYHGINRITDRLCQLAPADKDMFVQYMREYEIYCGVRLVTFNVMDDHFHIVLDVPRKPDTPLTDDELLSRVESLSGSGGRKRTRQLLTQFRLLGLNEAAEALRERHLVRMWSLSEYMKALEQRFTQWFNKAHDRSGTLWKSRFKSVLVESEGEALATVAAYVDINAVRAKCKEDPTHYRWCGYGQAILGDTRAQEGLRVVIAAEQRVEPQSLSVSQAMDQYRRWFDEPGEQAEGTEQTGALTPEQAMEIIRRDGTIAPKDYVKLSLRYFSDGLAVGSQIFINELLEVLRPRWRNRRDGAKRMLGVRSDNLYVLGKLRRDPIGWLNKAGRAGAGTKRANVTGLPSG
jgi:hypothetical protein